MSYFKTKMHQIRSPLGLCPKPRWEAYSVSLDLLAKFKGSYFYEKKGENKKRKEKAKEEKTGKKGEDQTFFPEQKFWLRFLFKPETEQRIL